MKALILSCLSMFSFVALAGNTVSISPQALVDSANSDWLILDVRSAEEYNQGHVPGAMNVSHDLLSKNLSEIIEFKDKPVVVYCRSGFRAGKAIKILRNNDFSQVKHLEGDMLKWQDLGFDIEK